MPAVSENFADLPALGFLEVSSIARGLVLTDVVLKKSPVTMIASQPVSSGKYYLLYFGHVAEVEESHQAALEEVQDCLVRQILIPGVHPELIPYLRNFHKAQGHDLAYDKAGDESVAIVESSSLAGAILSADYALKAAQVRLCRMRLGQWIGGKAYFVLAGDQPDVEAAADTARDSLSGLDSLVRVDLIARPLEETLEYF